MPTEFSFIEQIRQRANKHADESLLGIGDDAAAWREQTGRERLITTDLLIEGVHFKLDYTPLRCLGHKALAVSLSDIAAMGGQPEYALLSLGLPKAQFSERNWQEFFDGYFALAETYGVKLVGGDTSGSPDKVVIDSIVLGSCASRQAIRRSGAQAGDAIYVTGSLGASAAGLALLQRGARLDETTNAMSQEALRAHLLPEARVNLGAALGASGLANAMLDVSDGLAQDLAHICEESSVDALLDFAAVPIAACAKALASSTDEAFAWAMSGGEDYELLLTAVPEREAEVQRCAAENNLRLTRIGQVIARDAAPQPPRIFLRQDGRVDLLTVTGYDHFRA